MCHGVCDALGCQFANGARVGAAGEAVSSPEPTESATPRSSESAAALEQAQAWLDAAALPPGAVRSEKSIGGFNSYTGWPCGPAEEIEAFWTIPGATVPATANWLMENPTADLMTTALSSVADDPAIDSTIVGFISEPGAQAGMVFTIAKAADGVAVRAEIAALTESATCQPLPDGGTWGPPGQG